MGIGANFGFSRIPSLVGIGIDTSRKIFNAKTLRCKVNNETTEKAGISGELFVMLRELCRFDTLR